MTDQTAKQKTPKVLGVILTVLGALVTLQGGFLLASGGTAYYVVGGLLVAAAGIQIFRGLAQGLWLYGGFMLLTLLWTLYEAGLDGWAQLPRMAMWLALGVWVILPRTRRLLGVEGKLLGTPAGQAAVGIPVIYAIVIVVANI